MGPLLCGLCSRRPANYSRFGAASGDSHQSIAGFRGDIVLAHSQSRIVVADCDIKVWLRTVPILSLSVIVANLVDYETPVGRPRFAPGSRVSVQHCTHCPARLRQFIADSSDVALCGAWDWEQVDHGQ